MRHAIFEALPGVLKAMKRLNLAPLAVLIAVTTLACATTSVANSGNSVISSVSPSQVVAGGTGFTLSVYGSGFVGNTVVLWNGSARATHVISKTELQASISSVDIQQAGSAKVTVADQRGNSMASNSVFVTIQAPAPLGVTTSSLPTGDVAGSYSATLTAKGGSPPYKWGVASGSLPPGLALSASTGAVTGTPIGSGQYSFTVQVQDSEASPQTATGAVGVSIASPLQINTTTLPSGQVQASYQVTVAATGGVAPYRWSVILGALPPGLALSASSGAVTGTPTASGQYSFTVQAQDSAASPQIAISALNINIAAAPPQITTSALPNGTVQVAYSAPLAATGGTLPYSWSVISGSLPPGLALSASTGAVTGTPTASGQYSFSLQVQDSAASPQTASKQLGISVGTPALQITTGTLPNGTVQAAYSATLAATGGTPPYMWSIASGSLPTGLLLASSGQISGIPTQAGSSSFTAQVQDSKNNTAMQALSISTATASGPSLSLVISGTGTNQIATVESSHQFRLVFEASDNWGLSQWYDLVNDPNATTNLAGPVYSVNGPSNPCAAEPGLQNMVFYGDNDAKLDMREAGCAFSNNTRSMTVLSSSPSLVVIQTSGHPMNSLPNTDTNITGTNTYYIFPNGQIYVHDTVSVVSAQDLSGGGSSDLFISTMELEDPTQQGTIPPDSQGWIRASATQNPYSYVGSQENYVFAYWGPGTPSPYTNYTKASIMLVPSPNNPTTLYQIIHSWSSGPGYGVVRWGYRMSPGPNMSAGQTIAYDFLLQLGTQGSSVLPNINSSAVADPIAASYRANPIPPAVTNPSRGYCCSGGYYSFRVSGGKSGRYD
jgi:hypothetical protein